MKKKKILPLIMLLLAAVLLTCIYIFVIKGKADTTENDETADSGTTESESIVLSEYTDDELVELKFKNGEFEGTIYKDDDIWKLKEAEDFPLIQSKADGMASNLLSISANMLIAENAELSEYGLDNPTITGEALLADGTTFSIQIGDKIPTATDYYATVNNGTTVYAVPIKTRTFLAYNKSALLEKESAPEIDTSTITRLSIASREYDDFDLTYDENNQYDYTGINSYPWYISSEFVTPQSADPSRVSEMLENYATIEFSTIVDYGIDNFAQYGLESPASLLFIEYATEESTDAAEDTDAAASTDSNTDTTADAADEETEVKMVRAQLLICFGDETEDGDSYVRFNDSDRIYTMTKANVDKLLQVDAFPLLNSFVSLINILHVSSIDIALPGENHLYEIETTTTTDSEGKEETTQSFIIDGTALSADDESSFKSLYQKLIGITYEGILPEDAAYSTETPVLTMKFSRETSELEDIEATYYEYTDSFYAVNVRGETVFYVDKRDVDALIESIQSFNN